MISLRFSKEEGQGTHLLGWCIISANNNKTYLDKMHILFKANDLLDPRILTDGSFARILAHIKENKLMSLVRSGSLFNLCILGLGRDGI